ncbi:MAG: glutamate racemase, partial [Pseudomonadota bacterium]
MCWDKLLNADKQAAIGVFDSGMGGLTVLAALRQALPDESFLYLGDTARLPYGTKSRHTVERYAQQAAEHLVERGIKMLVVACNTASGMALPALRSRFAGIPVVGVVEPGATAALQVADTSGVLVLATESTIQGGAYQAALSRRGRHVRVYGRSCPLWVTLAEMGVQDPAFTATVLARDLRGFVADGPRTVLLGCTHFPVFQAALRQLLPAGVNIVDSAQPTAAAVRAQPRLRWFVLNRQCSLPQAT